MDKKTYSNLVVSSAPHIVSNMDTSRIMLMVLIGLAPSLLVSTYVFGFRVITLSLVCVVAAMFFEWAWNKLMHKPQTVGDLSAAVTGLLIAFNVPSGLPYWIAILGCFVAIVIVKQLFGGMGKNIVNPAITARVILFISYATEMTTWTLPRMAADATSTATPLGVLAEGGQLPRLHRDRPRADARADRHARPHGCAYAGGHARARGSRGGARGARGRAGYARCR